MACLVSFVPVTRNLVSCCLLFLICLSAQLLTHPSVCLHGSLFSFYCSGFTVSSCLPLCICLKFQQRQRKKAGFDNLDIKLLKPAARIINLSLKTCFCSGQKIAKITLRPKTSKGPLLGEKQQTNEFIACHSNNAANNMSKLNIIFVKNGFNTAYQHAYKKGHSDDR